MADRTPPSVSLILDVNGMLVDPLAFPVVNVGNSVSPIATVIDFIDTNPTVEMNLTDPEGNVTVLATAPVRPGVPEQRRGEPTVFSEAGQYVVRVLARDSAGNGIDANWSIQVRKHSRRRINTRSQ